GASSQEIVRMLVSSEIKRLLVTTVLSGLLALWTIQKWLENYAYRVSVSPWIFILTGAVILLIALSVTAVISYRAATANPVEALRYE
ncbi:MAG: ABC transporter permease, partial [Calditrichia bacterium]